MIVYSVVGKIGSGKTFSCCYIENYLKSLGFPVLRISMADALKMFVFETFGILKNSNITKKEFEDKFLNKKEVISLRFFEFVDRNEFYVYPDKINEMTKAIETMLLNVPEKSIPRYILQQVGTNIFRKFVDPSFWVKIVVRNLQEIYDGSSVLKNAIILIDDIRFDNEFEEVSKVFCSSMILKTRNLQDTCLSLGISLRDYVQMSTHPSENGLSKIITRFPEVKNEEDLDIVCNMILKEIGNADRSFV